MFYDPIVLTPFLKIYDQALTIFEKTGDINNKAGTFVNIGIVYGELDQYQNALRNYDEALNLFRKIGNSQGESTVRRNIGEIYYKTGLMEDALRLYEHELESVRKIKDARGEVLVLGNMGRIFLHSGKPTKAESYLSSSIKVFQSIREVIHSGAERTGLQFSLPDIYGYLAASRVALGKPDKAFEAIEQGRAKSLLDLMGTRNVSFGKGNEKTEELKSLINRQEILSKAKMEFASAPVGKKKRSSVHALDKKISELDKQRIPGLKRSVRACFPCYAGNAEIRDVLRCFFLYSRLCEI